MAEEMDEAWRNKLVVKGLPQCSSDLITNYMEVVSSLSVSEENGVIFCGSITHTAIVTFTEELTEKIFHRICEQSRQKPLEGRQLSFDFIREPPASILVWEVPSSLTSDNLMYYFESPHAGCHDGEVEQCDVNHDNGFAVIKFSSPDVARSVMASKKHTPAKGTVVQVEPYYPEFHELLLNELKNIQKQVRPRKPLQAASEQRHPPMPTKPATNIRPPLLPKPSSRGGGRHDLFRQVPSYKDQYVSHETLELSEDNSFTTDERSYPSRDERGGRGYNRRRSRKNNYRGRARGFLPINNKPVHWDYHNLEESNDKQTFHETHPQRGKWGKNYHHHSNDFVGDDSFLDQAQSSDQHYRRKRSEIFEKQYSKQTRSHISPKAHDSMPKPVITLDADCNYVPFERPAVSDQNVVSSFSQNDKNFASDFSDSELYDRPTSQTDRSAEIQGILQEGNSCTTACKAAEINLTHQAANENLLRQKLAKEENERKEKDKVELERKKELEEENERLKRELEKFKSQKTETVDAPAYKLHLLSNFPQECRTCSVIFLQSDGKVKFTGSEDDCLAAKVDFLSRVQDLAEDNITLDEDIINILRSEKGKTYLSAVRETFSDCSMDLQGRVLTCAGHKMQNVQDFLQKIKRNILEEYVQVKTIEILNCPEFTAKKKKVEEEMMVRLITVDSGKLRVLGINGDVGVAKREIIDFIDCQRPGRKIFQIQGLLAGRACKHWFSAQLFNAKALITKNGKILDEQETSAKYILQYECQQSFLDEVEKKLDFIKKSICTAPFDLKHPFATYTDYALVVNGLHNFGLKQYIAGLEQTLKDQGLEALVTFSLPPKCQLPKQRFMMTQRNQKSQSSTRETKPVHRRHKHHTYHHRPFQPFSVSVGPSGTQLTIKSGDITVEKVDALVSVVGADLDLKGTAVGGAILKKCPTAGQVLQSNPTAAQLVRQQLHQQQLQQLQQQQLQQLQQLQFHQPVAAADVQVIPTQLPAAQSQVNQLQTNFILHAVINKAGSSRNVTVKIKSIVEECLQTAGKYRKTSIAFPPIGAGRKFKFPEDTVITTMIDTIKQFLSSQPHHFQNVNIVIYDRSVAKKFKNILQQTSQAPTVGAAISDEDEEDDIVESDDDNAALGIDDVDISVNNDSGDELPWINLEEDETSSVDASLLDSESTGSVCTLKQENISKVRKAVAQSLKAQFLCQETVPNTETIRKLSQKDLSEIEDEAIKNCVVLRMQAAPDRKQSLVLRGQPLGMSKTMTFINDKMMAQLQKMKEEGNRRHSKSTLDKHDFPTYWKSHEMGTIENWFRSNRKQGKLFTVDDKEKSAVEQLVKATWQQQYVGHGKDGVGLTHTNIQVVKVERLENPTLWDQYKHRRERIYLSHGCTHVQPIEKLPGSKSPVLTTASVPRGSPLRQQIYPAEVNEHYLFHGTKKEYVNNIVATGLDSRIASEKAMLGQGIYAAESPTKADQYTDDKRQRTSGHKTMLLMRVLLGEPFINANVNPVKFKRPPCKNCLKDVCTCNHPSHFDSVIDDAGRNFREFVIYDFSMCYPEYFITYQRL